MADATQVASAGKSWHVVNGHCDCGSLGGDCDDNLFPVKKSNVVDDAVFHLSDLPSDLGIAGHMKVLGHFLDHTSSRMIKMIAVCIP
jgi:hypothetical protein